MESTQKVNRSKISPEKLKEIKVHWRMLNQPTQEALENYNRILAKAQLRVYHQVFGSK
ncbi:MULTISPECIES: hypothetical protein [Pelosinus]|uniref:Uncharacterized protein n=1 Tax=Pelosinus fermentans B4 TaxID=1149862 RepID=I9LE07_9FIRM|nr:MULTISPECIES: hypothetical protein [Pelosinus]EIW18591.1 hypothetical protein FB4_3411 [Pelosinus fermentans B4]EIW24370.1 hypothetical protein FA11_3412 [Pelosinus fermentans A11]OAM94337.1 hypothetical protein FR7_02355 [Pelosinus fermentans DSM 17108]SDR06526.1 hypothetical protein SAMN04515679_2459 [Pelosinus fermentans]